MQTMQRTEGHHVVGLTSKYVPDLLLRRYRGLYL